MVSNYSLLQLNHYSLHRPVAGLIREEMNELLSFYKGQVVNNLKANATLKFFRALLVLVDHLDHQ